MHRSLMEQYQEMSGIKLECRHYPKRYEFVVLNEKGHAKLFGTSFKAASEYHRKLMDEWIAERDKM